MWVSATIIICFLHVKARCRAAEDHLSLNTGSLLIAECLKLVWFSWWENNQKMAKDNRVRPDWLCISLRSAWLMEHLIRWLHFVFLLYIQHMEKYNHFHQMTWIIVLEWHVWLRSWNIELKAENYFRFYFSGVETFGTFLRWCNSGKGIRHSHLFSSHRALWCGQRQPFCTVDYG